jgi:hypothetical protein
VGPFILAGLEMQQLIEQKPAAQAPRFVADLDIQNFVAAYSARPPTLM